MKNIKRSTSLMCALIAMLCGLFTQTAIADGFLATVSPPRFELQAKAGKLVRDTVEIGNPGSQAGEFRIRTADWEMSEQGKLSFNLDSPPQNSCRPWVKIERHIVKVRPRASKRYRFEVHVPEDAAVGECRFALMIEPVEGAEVMARAGNVQFPVQGRIAVIVYLTVNNAKPQLQYQGIRLIGDNSPQHAVVVFKNIGNAHGRPQGVLEGRDAKGDRFDVNVSPIPLLPGQTREIDLWPVDLENKPKPFVAPLQVKGRIEWEGGHYDIDARVE